MPIPDTANDNQDLNKAIADSLASLNYGDIDDGDQNQNKPQLQHLSPHQQPYEYGNEGSNEVQTEDHEDLDLENAIGDVFNQFDFDNISKDAEASKEDAKDEEVQEQKIEETEQEHEEFDLEAAIGDAFANAFDLKEKTAEHSEEMEGVEEEKEIKHEEHLEDDFNDNALEDAIGDAFKSVTDHFKPLEPVEQPTEQVEDDDDDLDLDAAIGDAFKSIAKPKLLYDQLNIAQFTRRPIPSEKLARAIGQAFRGELSYRQESDIPLTGEQTHLYQNLEKEITRDEPEHDDDLKHVIFESFKQILGDHQEEPVVPKPTIDTQSNIEDVLESTVFKAFNDANKAPRRPSVSVNPAAKTEIANAVQNIVSHMNHEDTNIDSLSVPEDILQELALEITSHLQLADGEAVEPQQVEDEPAVSDDKLKAALASAVKQAIGTGSQQQRKDKTIDTDLESLQINDIMQNAFDMAMENPQGLLDNIESQEQKSQPEKPKPTYPSAIETKLPDTTVARKPSTFDQIITPSANKDSLPKKSLSIAETLAIHRSSMFNGSKDFPTLANGKLTNPSTNPHLSQVLSTLSSHIHSNNGSDSNILQVIRQMTDALSSQTQRSQNRPSFLLTLTTTSIRSTPSVYDITSQYIDKTSKEGMIQSLNMAKKFLQEDTRTLNLSDKPKAVSLVDKALTMFNSNTLYDSTTISITKMEEMSSLNETIISTIYNYSTSRFKTSFILDKPNINSPEYKERIRLENRERKKKWREDNAERNKDNDLRARVIKRANVMFSEKDTKEKKAWIEDEFSRRKEKRIIKQRKDEELLQLLDEDGKLSVHKYDIELARPVSDLFNVLSLSASKEDPKVVLAAAAAGAAAASIVHGKGSDIESSIQSIISSVFDSALETGQNERVKILYKGAQALQLLPQEPTPSSTGPVSSVLGLLNINLDNSKRTSVEVLQNDTKRLKPSTPTPDEGEEAKKDTVNSTQLLNSVNALKMPSYKRPESGAETAIHVKIEGPKVTGPSLQLSKASPFISNKSGFSSLKDESETGNSTMKKPGSFQRPAYSKPKERNMGFPPLFSTSFKLT